MAISNRERFKAIARFQRPGDPFVVDDFHPIGLLNWVQQGADKRILGEGKSDKALSWGSSFINEYFGLENKVAISEVKSGWSGGTASDLGHNITVVGGSPLVPAFEPRIIAEDERSITHINASGQTMVTLKTNIYSMSTFIDWPVKDRATWKKLKKRLDPNTPERWPKDWNAYVQQLNSQDDPVTLDVGGFYGWCREWIGSENVLYMFYDDPGLIEDIMDTILYLEMEIIKRVVKDINVDEADFWEDMAYNSGPMISPDMVKRFMVPRYKKITDLLHSKGIDIIFVDSDGSLDHLIPLWLDSGINYVWPLEQASIGNDPVALRKKYPDLIMGGGIDKRALEKGKEAIKEELMSKVPFLLEKGGYFPCIDQVPPDITFENYCYYINTIREVAGLEKLVF